MKRRFLVTGGAGFIGSHTVDALLAAGQDVLCIDNFDDHYNPELKRQHCRAHREHPNYSLVEADVCDAGRILRLFRSFKPEIVIHLAARVGVRSSMSDSKRTTRVNVHGTRTILEGCRDVSVTRMVNASSSSVYGTNLHGPASEDLQARPISPYAESKLAAEAACSFHARQHGLGIASLRFFTVYGPRQRPDMAIARFAQLMRSGESLPIYGDGSSSRDFTFVGDVVAAILAASSHSCGGHEVFNVGSGHPVQLSELVAVLSRKLGIGWTCHHLPAQPGDVDATHADIRKARRLLWFKPSVSFEEGIDRYVRSLHTSGGAPCSVSENALRSAPLRTTPRGSANP